jgi:hypothetical protein
MEKRFDSLTVFEFGQKFPDDNAYMKHLSKVKYALYADIRIIADTIRSIRMTGSLPSAIISMQLSENTVGRKNVKKIVVFGIEIVKCGISRAYGKVITNASAKSLGGFMEDTVDVSSDVQTGEWTGYKP